MKELFLLLALTFNPAGQYYSDADYRALWAKVETALEEDRPQTAVIYLNQLEELTVSKKDTLERYQVMKTTYDCLRQYDWKAANKYYPGYKELYRELTGNLDYYIERYAEHPRAGALVYEKIMKKKRAEDMLRHPSGENYSRIRQMCILAAEQYPKSEKELMEVVEQMDSVDAGMSCPRHFIYPGQTLTFELRGRNISSSEFLVYRLKDRYQTDFGITKEQAASFGTQFSRQNISSYKNDYNVPETTTAEYTFGKPGIYVVFNTAGDRVSSETVYVSSVALATRQAGGANQIYVADARSGKPLGNATVYAFEANAPSGEDPAPVKPAYLSQKIYTLNGFTPLTQNLFAKQSDASQIFAEYASDMWSPAVDISRVVAVKEKRSADVIHYIYTDRKLYRATDTIFFKLIALSTNYESGKVLSGKKTEVSLYAPDSDKPVARVKFTTNSMGSAAGSFVIPAGGKNGRYRISSEFGSASVRVEEYKDPKYKLELDKISTLYTFGETVSQTGRLTGYTAEPVAEARVEYTVQIYSYGGGSRIVIADGQVRTDADGFFDIPFTLPQSFDANFTTAACQVSVKAVARNGETCGKSRYVMVCREPLSFEMEFDNQYQMDSLLLVNKDKAPRLNVSAANSDGAPQGIEGSCRLLTEEGDEAVMSKKITFGEPFDIDYSALPSGLYTLECKAETALGTSTYRRKVAFFSPDDRHCPVEREMFFYPVDDKGVIDFVVGSSSELYLELELFDNGKVVYRRALHLNKDAQHVKLDYKATYGDQVTVSLFGFKDMEQISLRHDFCREISSGNFEIKVSSLRDKTTPRTTETFTVEAPASELLVSVYDVTCDRYSKNEFFFNPIHPRYIPVPHIWSNTAGFRPVKYRDLGATRMMAAGAVAEEAVVFNAVATADDAVPFVKVDAAADTDVREDFSQTLAFIPQLPVKGKTSVTFTTRDNLASFRILMLAHTKKLQSGTAECQIIVNKAVKIEASLPLFAVEGDRLAVTAMVTNTSREKVAGKAHIALTDAATGGALDADFADSEVSLAPGESKRVSWVVGIPSGISRMGVTVGFAAKNATDAEKHQVAILPASRTVTEAASFIVGGGRSKESCIRDLQSRFHYPDATVRYEEYSTKEAIAQVLVQPDYPRGDNVIEWIDALYVNQMRGCIHGTEAIDVTFARKAVARLASAQNADGGFGWFPGNASSDMLTLMFLDKTYYMREVGKLPRGTSVNILIEKALGYVDKRIFEITSAKKWDWRDLTYLFAARMEHPNFAMSAPIQKILLEYLRRSKSGWQKIPVVEKAKLCFVLEATGENSHLFAVMRSLRDYSVRNNTVGCYFPNAAMPYRGMLHTEIYAHSLLAVIFAEMGQMDIAKGIMKWLLLQKHNQQWESNMASADAIFALIKYNAPEMLFGAVYYTYCAPMLDIKPSSNQMEVKRTYWRDGTQLSDGQMLRVGDRIEVRYEINNTENRSFVVMEASRPACFYPADERSFGTYRFYCERKASHTTYYFQVLPEEQTRLSEIFYVTQEGTFNSGLVQIESLYAPEYRAHTGAFRFETESE